MVRGMGIKSDNGTSDIEKRLSPKDKRNKTPRRTKRKVKNDDGKHMTDFFSSTPRQTTRNYSEGSQALQKIENSLDELQKCTGKIGSRT